MKRVSISIITAIWLGLVFQATPSRADDTDQANSVDFFEKNVRPVLIDRCFACHDGSSLDKRKGGLRLDSRESLLKGGDSGPAIEPGKPDESLLILAISHQESLKMPPKRKLSANEIANLTRWIQAGAPWPAAAKTTNSTPIAAKTDRQFTTEEKAFWAFQPLPTSPPLPPRVKNQAWVRSPIDQFLLANLEQQGLSPSTAADKATWLRRAYYDLTGLPPTLDDIKSFLADTEPNAYDKVVDRLLASPRYGEKWGRHWLDVVRYADTNGMDENLVQSNAFRYRDYVIQAFNQDKPYDQFLREQIAGDLLETPSLVATGFLVIGPKMLAEDDPKKMELDIIDEQIDTIGKTFMGLTLGCARCHDHKFDPILASDYYALAGIFKSTKVMDHFKVVARWHERPIGSQEQTAKVEAIQNQIDSKQKELDAFKKTVGDRILSKTQSQTTHYFEAARQWKIMQFALALQPFSKQWKNHFLSQLAKPHKLKSFFIEQLSKEKNLDSKALAIAINNPTGLFTLPTKSETLFDVKDRQQFDQFQQEIASLEKSKPELPHTMAAAEGQITDLPVLLRGNYLTPGTQSPRKIPRILATTFSHDPVIDQKQSGRLQLAQWLTRPNHPLTSRVMVNRIWRWHFGTGLVRSVDNFGKLGERPSHPELLDWLAIEFVKSGWSIKAMHRLIMLSSAYRMSSQANPNQETQASILDPDNRGLRRFPRRRLNAEEIRDSMLFLSGQLDLTLGGSLMGGENRDYVPCYPNKFYDNYDVPRRSVYIPILRSSLYEVFQIFDFIDPSTPNGDRVPTTIASQALCLMNSKLILDQSAHWADKLLKTKFANTADRVRHACQASWGRSPTDQELIRLLDFLIQADELLVSSIPKADERKRRCWQSLCKTLLASHDFVYVE